MNRLLLMSLTLANLIFTNPAFSQTSLADNPVVIQYGDIEMNRRQFELEFELLMVVNAVQEGVPIKDQQKIMGMQYRFLDQRAYEFYLLDIARDKGITITEAQLQSGLDDFMQNLGFSEYNKGNVAKLGMGNEQVIQTYIREKLMVSNLIEQVKKDMKVDSSNINLKAYLSNKYGESRAKTYPERLRSPLARRFDER